MRLNYTKDGTKYSDFECVEEVKRLAGLPDDIITSSSTENIFNAARALYKQGEIKVKDLIFYFNGKEVGHCSKFGKIILNDDIPEWPKGFVDFFENCLDAILGLDEIK